MKLSFAKQIGAILSLTAASVILGCVNLFSSCPLTLRDAVVLKSKIECKKKLFYVRPNINLIWDIKLDENRFGLCSNIVVLTSNGIAHLNADGGEIQFVKFGGVGEIYNGKFYDIDGDFNLEVLGNLPDYNADVLLDSNGKSISRLSARAYDSPAIGDVNCDGQKDIILESRSRHLQAYRISGSEIHSFRQEVRPWRYKVAFSDTGKTVVILYAYFLDTGAVYLLDGEGEILSQWRPKNDFYDFSILPERHGMASQFVYASGDEIVICDLDGHVVQTFQAPLGSFLRSVVCAKHMVGDQVAHYIVIGKTKGVWNRSMIFIYSDKGEILYHEILTDTCLALLVRDRKTISGEWSILLGCRNRVFEYSIQ